MLKPALRRKRRPIGGDFGSVVVEAQCVAGRTKARCVVGTVKRRAWFIAPAATSSNRARPTKTGSPAASAEVQVYGRCSLIVMSQMAVESALHWPLFNAA